MDQHVNVVDSLLLAGLIGLNKLSTSLSIEHK